MSNSTERLNSIIETLRTVTAPYPPPMTTTIIAEYGRDPFLILISCLLSLRARDTTTIHVCRNLFAHIRSPRELLAIPQETLENFIFKTGYYRVKAQTLKHVSREILERFGGKVPHTKEELLSIKGVGIKTANLVLGLAFGIPAICVDIHVHRISNRLGLIKTKSPEESEKALQAILPKDVWIEWNHLLVTWGQNICTPIRPSCSKCPVRPWCERVGVGSSR